MSEFRNRLSKACEAAQSNLKSAQSQLKIHYDENAQDKNFEPGDKVLALLPIPGKPLQARYYGPYTVDKKIVCLFDLIIYVPSTIFQLYRNGSSWVEPVLS